MKVIGIMTKDFKFFYELISLMKANKQTFVSLDFRDPVPENGRGHYNYQGREERGPVQIDRGQ